MLKVNVGLTQKATADYQSEGQSISIETELDASLLTKPGEFQDKIADLYAQAREALDRQVGQPVVASAPAPRSAPVRTSVAKPAHAGTRQPPTSPAPAGRTGSTAGRVGGNTPPAATDSQIKAIRAIAQTMGIDPEAEADALGFKFPLTRGDASRLIDHLKSMQQPQRAAA